MSTGFNGHKIYNAVEDHRPGDTDRDTIVRGNHLVSGFLASGKQALIATESNEAELIFGPKVEVDEKYRMKDIETGEDTFRLVRGPRESDTSTALVFTQTIADTPSTTQEYEIASFKNDMVQFNAPVKIHGELTVVDDNGDSDGNAVFQEQLVIQSEANLEMQKNTQILFHSDLDSDNTPDFFIDVSGAILRLGDTDEDPTMQVHSDHVKIKGDLKVDGTLTTVDGTEAEFREHVKFSHAGSRAVYVEELNSAELYNTGDLFENFSIAKFSYENEDQTLSRALVDEASTARAEEQTLSSALGDEISTARAEEQAISSALGDEVSTARAEEQAISSALGDEVSTARAEEQAISSALGDEVSTARAEEQAISAALGDEVSTARAEEQAISSALGDEVSTARAEEQAISSALGDEVSTARAEEQAISSALGDEVSTARAEEQAISSALGDEVSTARAEEQAISSALGDEVSTARAEEQAISSALGDEVSTARAEEQAISSALGDEVSTARAEEQAISSALGDEVSTARAEEQAISAALGDEVSTARAEEQAISSALGDEVSTARAEEQAISSALGDEVSTARAEEQAISSALGDEVSTARAEEQAISSALGDEVSTARAEEQAISSALGDEVSTARAEEQAISSALGDEVSTARAEEQAISSALGDEVSTARAEEQAISSALGDEVSTARAEEQAISSALGDEVSTARAEEQAISSALGDEVSTARAEEQAISSALGDEVSTARAEEQAISSALGDEVSTARAEEQAISSALGDEVSTARAEEQAISSALGDEVSTARAEEQAISSALGDEVSTARAEEEAISSALGDEVSTARANELEITNDLNAKFTQVQEFTLDTEEALFYVKDGMRPTTVGQMYVDENGFMRIRMPDNLSTLNGIFDGRVNSAFNDNGDTLDVEFGFENPGYDGPSTLLQYYSLDPGNAGSNQYSTYNDPLNRDTSIDPFAADLDISFNSIPYRYQANHIIEVDENDSTFPGDILTAIKNQYSSATELRYINYTQGNNPDILLVVFDSDGTQSSYKAVALSVNGATTFFAGLTRNYDNILSVDTSDTSDDQTIVYNHRNYVIDSDSGDPDNYLIKTSATYGGGYNGSDIANQSDLMLEIKRRLGDSAEHVSSFKVKDTATDTTTAGTYAAVQKNAGYEGEANIVLVRYTEGGGNKYKAYLLL